MSDNEKLNLTKEEHSRIGLIKKYKIYVIGFICFLIGFIVAPNGIDESDYKEVIEKADKMETELKNSNELVKNLESEVSQAKVFLDLNVDDKKIIETNIKELKAKKEEELKKQQEEEEARKKAEKESIELTPKNLNVKIEESIEKDNGKIRFNIKTNLPDSAELMVGIFEVNGDYRGQTHAIVKNGEAQTEWFSNQGEALEIGEYQLSISMSIPATQSEEVQKAVGKNGEYLEGNLAVRENGMTHVSMGKNITLK